MKTKNIWALDEKFYKIIKRTIWGKMYCHWSNSFNKNFNTKNSMGFRGKFWYLEGDMGQTGMSHTQFIKIFVKEKVWVFYENIIKSMREQYGSNRIVPDRFFFDKVWTLKNIWPCKNMYKILKRTTWAKLHFPRNNYFNKHSNTKECISFRGNFL